MIYVHPSCSVSSDCKIGHNVVIEENVRIGDGVKIGNNTVIHSGTIIEDYCRIGDNCVLGPQPLKSPLSTRQTTEQPPLKVGTNCVIGSLVLISAGTEVERHCLIADHASIRESCRIGEKTIVGKSVTLEFEIVIGQKCKIMNQTQLTGKMVIGNEVFFGPDVSTMNDKYMDRVLNPEMQYSGAKIGDYSRIGGNSTILPGITIGEDVLVAAGAVVVRDIPDYAVVMGVPARIVRYLNPQERKLPAP